MIKDSHQVEASAPPTPEQKRVGFFGRAKRTQIVLAVLTFGFWLLVPLTGWLWRTGRKRRAYVVGGVSGFLVLLVALSVAFGDTKSTSAAEDSTVATVPRETTPTATVPTTAVTKPKPKDAPKATPAPKPAAPKPRPAATPAPAPNKEVDTHTREYIAGVQTCQVGMGLVLIDIKRDESDLIKLADSATQGRDVCDSERSQLAATSTDHFDDEALAAWSGVDRAKSGLNALLAYLDNPAPSKLIEVRDKLAEGDQDMAQGIRQINARRVVYGLKPIKT